MTIKLYDNQLLKNKLLGRIAFNSAFIDEKKNDIIFNLNEIDPDSLFSNKKIPKDFKIIIKFIKLCDCNNKTTPIKVCSICEKQVSNQFNSWKELNSILDNHKLDKEIGTKVLFGNAENDDVEEILKEPEEIENEGGDKKKEDLNTSFDGDCLIV